MLVSIKTLKVAVLLFAVFTVSQITAQETLTLEQAIELSLKNNYDILIARNEAEIADRNNTIGNAGMLPTINATLSDAYTLNNLNQKFSNGNPEIARAGVNTNNVQAAVALNWVLFDGFRMFATKGRLSRLEEIGALQLKDQVQTTVAQVILAYYNVVGSKQQLIAIEEAIRIAEERAKIAEAKFTVGSASKVDYLQARVDANQQRSNQFSQRTAIQQRKAELNRLLVRPADTQFEVTDTILINLEPALTPADIEKKNFQLAIAAKNIEVAQFAKKEAFSGFLPWLNGTVGYGFGRTQTDAGFSLYNQTYGLQAGFQLVVPLFNGLNTIRQNKIAGIQVQTANYSFENARLQTNVAYYNQLRNFENAKEVLQLEETNVQLADENAKIALERFRLAQSTSLELREAQLSLVDAQTRVVNARLNAKYAETELMRLQGELVK